MRHLITILAILALSGCAHNVRKAKAYTAPSFTGIAVPLKQASTAIKGAQKKASSLKVHVQAPGLPIWEEMSKDLEEANKAAAEATSALAGAKKETQALADKASWEAAGREKAEIKAETCRKEALHNGRRGDILAVILAVGAALWGSAALMPTLRTRMIPLAATGWGAIAIMALPFVLPVALAFAAFWAIRFGLEAIMRVFSL